MPDLDDIFEVHKDLFIGAYWPRLNFKKLKKNGITAIVNLMDDNHYDPRPLGFAYLFRGFPDDTYVPDGYLKDILEFIDELKERYYEVTSKPVALVCALGTNIARPGILAKAAIALSDNKVNIECFSQSLKQVNMQFVINREDYNKAITVLNDALCVNNND